MPTAIAPRAAKLLKILFTNLYQSLRRSALGARLTRYTIGSIVAAITSAIVFALLYVLGAGTTACSVSAFVAGAIPNWILNRRWAWKVAGQVAFGREVVAYVGISAIQLLATSATTAWTQARVQSIPAHHGIRAALVTTSYLAVFAVMFVGKFAIYEKWIFSGRSRVRAAIRSRRDLWATNRTNRTADSERAV
jgi:putative flippase GtrA